MNIDDQDKAILEYAVNGEPWHIVCGCFYYTFDDPKELVRRVIRLSNNGLIRIEKHTESSAEASIQTLIKQAEDHSWFEEELNPRDDNWWEIRTTDNGFAIVKDRFN